MVASVTLTGSGNVGKLGPKWAVNQQCTPVAPGDTSGSVGSASLDAFARSTSVFAIDNDLTLTDTTAGEFRGNVVASPVTGRKVHLDVAGKLNFLVADRTVDPVWFDGADPLLFGEVGSPVNGGALGTFGSVYDIAIDPFDNSIFVSSYGTVTIGSLLTLDKYLVIKYSAAGVYITQFGGTIVGGGIGFGDSGSGNGFFGGATGIAVSPVDGSVAVGDGANNRVQIFTPNAGRTLYSYSTKVGTLGAGNGQFGGTAPIPVVYDSTGALYAGDRGNSRMQKFTISGTTVTYVSQVSFNGFSPIATTPPYKLTISSSNIIYASVINGTSGADGNIRSYNTSLAVQNTYKIAAPTGTSSGVLSISADDTGLWVNWGLSNYVAHYTFSGTVATEDKRWYSGFPVIPDLTTNYVTAVKTTGEVVVLLKDPLTTPVTKYGTYKVTSFDWGAVPLSDAIETYMLECDSTLGGLSYSYDASSDPDVIFPAWSGDVWSHLKEICTAFQVDIILDGGTIRVTDVGDREIVLRNHSPLKVTPTNLFGGQQLVMVAQNPVAGGGTVYDASTLNTRYQIDVGQTSTVFINTLHYMSYIDVLVPADVLPVVPGQYYVIDAVGAHVPAATWLAAGGSVIPSLGDSLGQIKLILTGPPAAISGYTGPFTFATSTASTGRAALIVTGAGTFTTPVAYTFGTGANTTKTTQLVAKTINSFAIADVEQIARVTPAAIDDVSGYNVEVTFEIFTTDLLGFGLTQGAIFSAEDSKYRVTNIQWGALKSQITATRHVTLDDLDTITAGMTVDQRDTIFTGYSIDDRGIKPLALAL